MKVRKTRRALALLLALIMVAATLPLTVFAADEVATEMAVTCDIGAIRNFHKVWDVAEKISNAVTEVSGSHAYVAHSSYTGTLYTYVDGVATRCDDMELMVPDKEYWVQLELYRNTGYELPEALTNGGTVDNFKITINDVVIDFAESATTGRGKTYDVTFDWGTSNLCVIVPLALVFGEVDCSPCVENVWGVPEYKTIQKGTSYTFEVDVDAYNGAGDTVTWSIDEQSFQYYGEVQPGTTVDQNGKVTVDPNEEVAVFYVVATSTVNPEAAAYICVDVSDEAPGFTEFGFQEDGYEVFAGDEIGWIGVTAYGSETDKRMNYTLTGANMAGTRISRAVDSGVSVEIDEKETAEVLTLTVTSVAHPECTATMTIRVKPLTVLSEVKLELDYSKVTFVESLTEGEVQDQIFDNLTVAAEQDGVIYLDPNNCWLSYETDWGALFGIGSGNESVDLSKKYIMSMMLELGEGYTWSDALKNEEMDSIDIVINGVSFKMAVLPEYFEGSNSVKLHVIPDWYDAAFSGVNMSLGTDLSMNYAVKVNDAENAPASKLAVQFTVAGETITVKNRTVVDGQLVFRLPMVPQELAETITASLVLLEDDGVSVARVLRKHVYSVQKYITDLREGELDDTTVALIDALLVYSYYASWYMDTDYSLLDYVGAAGAESEAVPTESDKMTMVGNKNANCKFTVAGVRFGAQNRVYVKIYSTTADFTVTVGEKVYTAADCEEVESNVYKLTLDPMTAGELIDTVYTMTLSDGESDVSVLTVGLAGYVYGRMAGEDNVGLKLALAVYRYGVAAKAYAEAHS